jgi:uncharacterized membrane protein YgdD (TMEM256/DUF423 family)
VAIAGLLGAAGVGLGAFGAHALRARVDERLLEVWNTGVRYHLVHVLAMLAVAWALDRWPGPAARAAACCVLAGIVVFSGSLYLMVLSGHRWLGAVTPIGGIALIAGWLLLAWAAWRKPGDR